MAAEEGEEEEEEEDGAMDRIIIHRIQQHLVDHVL